jgi:hypothetical protein
MRDFERNIYIKIRIKRININWDGEVDFIAEKNYYKEEIK